MVLSNSGGILVENFPWIVGKPLGTVSASVVSFLSLFDDENLGFMGLYENGLD